MNQNNEITRNRKIHLEFIAFNRTNHPIALDRPPEVTIKRKNPNGLQLIDNVKLNVMKNLSYSTDYNTRKLSAGSYFLIYQGFYHQKKISKTDSVSIVEPAVKVLETESEDNAETSSTDLTKAILPPDYQIETQKVIKNQQITITPITKLNYNTDYVIVLGSSIQSENGDSLEQTKTIQFSSEFCPLYAEPNELKNPLGVFFNLFKQKALYIELRNASQKAHQLIGRTPDPNNTSFQLLTELDTQYFPTTKFVIYEAAIHLLNQLLFILISKQENISSDPDTGEIIDTSDLAKFTLGDLSVESQSTSDGNGNSNSSSQINYVNLINTMLADANRNLLFWQDALLNRNARGYSSPLSAVTRSGTTAPTSRDF
jgi:hypothetical protein